MRPTALLPLLLPAVLLATVVPAAGAAERPPGVTVSPSRIDATAQVGDTLPPVRVTNDSAVTQRFRITPLPATQERSGLPRYDESAAGVAEGRRRFTLSTTTLTVPPRATRTLQVEVAACPSDGIGLYGVLAFDVLHSAGARAQVAPNLRLVSTMLVRFAPRATCLDGRVVSAVAEQRGDRLGLIAGIQNLGDFHAKPIVGLTVSRGGRELRRMDAPPENILPGAVRDTQVTIPGDPLPAGEYTVAVTGRLGRGKLERSFPMTLDAPNHLAAPALRVENPTVQGARPGHAGAVIATVANSGSRPGGGRMEVAVAKAGSGTAFLRRTVRVAKLAPGAKVRRTIRLPELENASYRVTAVLHPDSASVEQAEMSFTVAPPAARGDRLRDWASAHFPTLVLGVAAAAALLLLGALLALWRRARRRRRGDAQVLPTADELARLHAALARLEQLEPREKQEA